MAIYMNFNGNNPSGNVTAAGYENWIEVDSMSFGVGRSTRCVGTPIRLQTNVRTAPGGQAIPR